jgi:amidase
VTGFATTAGIPDLAQNRPARDSDVAARLKAAGAVIWGKTNVPVMAGDWQSFTRLYGTTNNPWDTDRTPGGSSGGAAAALAAHVTALEIGSDIGGSLRIPASFCGVFSHKPTWGMVSQHGHIPPRPGSWAEPDLNVIGPMARSARDLRLLLSIIEDGPLAPKAPPADLKTTRIGLWLDDPVLPLDPQVKAVVTAFVGDLTAAGVSVEPVQPVDTAELLDAYLLLLGSIVAADMPKGRRRTMELMRGPAGLAKAWGAGPFSRWSRLLGYTARHREWLAADAVRARLRHEMDQLFDRFDVVLAPIAPVAAFPHDHRPFERRALTDSTGARLPYVSLLSWISLATACGLPATAIPAGFTATGLPVGVQLIGRRGDDARTLSLAQAVDENVRGFMAPPLPA